MKKQYNDRKEMVCSKCGKSRMLSFIEADEDGWVHDTRYKGLICYNCREKYGIPAMFIAGIPARAIAIDGGFAIEYDNQERNIQQI